MPHQELEGVCLGSVGGWVAASVPDQHTTSRLLGPVCHHMNCSNYIWCMYASPFACM